MCRAKREGGGRCAAATRPAFTKALGAVLDADTLEDAIRLRATHAGAVLVHAATPTGHREVLAAAKRLHAELSRPHQPRVAASKPSHGSSAAPKVHRRRPSCSSPRPTTARPP